MTDSTVTGNTRDSHEDRDEFARSNDPLLELSRIFGFEQPTAPQAENDPVASHGTYAPTAPHSDDPSLQYYVDEQGEQSHAEQLYAPQQDYAPQAHAQQNYSQQDGYAQQGNAYASAPQTDAELDLERELLSDFDQHFAADFAEPQAVQPLDTPQNPYQPEAAPERYLSDEEIFASLESDLSYDFAEPEAARYEAPDQAEPSLDTADFADIGREPQFQQYEPHYQAQTPSYTEAQDYTAVPQSSVKSAVAPEVSRELSLEDELAFLLQDPQPQQEQNSSWAAEPVAAATDFAPLFDAPQTPVSHYADNYAEESYSDPHNASLREDEPVHDEIFDVPEVSHPPHRDVETVELTEAFFTPEAEQFVAEPVAEPAINVIAEPVTAAVVPAASPMLPRGNFNPFAPAQLYGAVRETPVAQPVVAQETVEAPTSNSGFDDVFNASSARDDVNDHFAGQEQEQDLAQGTEDDTWLPDAPGGKWAPEDNWPIQDPAQDNSGEWNSVVAADPEPAATEDFFNSDDFNFNFADDLPVEYAEPLAQQDAYVAPVSATSGVSSAQSYNASSAYIPAPDVESLAVLENKVEQTQALDLPSIEFGTDRNDSGISSLESEFAEIFSTISVDEGSIVADSTSEADRAFENILQDGFADYGQSIKAGQSAQTASQINEFDESSFGDTFGTVAGGAAVAAVAGAAAFAGQRPVQSASQGSVQSGANPLGDNQANRDDYYNHWAAQGAQTDDFEKFDLGNNFDRDAGEYDDFEQYQPEKRSKSLLWGSVAAVALLVLGGGYYALKSGGVVGGDPVIIQADSQPVKVQPENPGGATVPNQDKAVYDQVSGTKPVAPQQTTLINTEEQPVDVGLLQGADAEEDRVFDEQLSEMPGMVQPAPEPAEQPLIAPRTVKTMVVRPDGTIVANDDVAPTTPATPAPTATDAGLDEAARLISQSATPERLTTETPVASAQSAAKPRVVQTQTFTANGEQFVAPKVAAPTPTPATVPVVPSRPAEQPVTIVGNVSAPVATPSANVPAGTWFIQVASQPSAELAQKNYVNLTSRYGNVIGGRGVDIKKAEIAGKGTYFRVRIPAGSKAEAGALCERLKSAGGSCFPTL